LQTTDYGYHGRGIYTSPNGGMSAGYAQLGGGGGGGDAGDGVYLPRESVIGCMALCEIVDTGVEVVQEVTQHQMHDGRQNVVEKLGSIKRVGEEWIVPDEDYIVTRFLFVFAQAGGCSAVTTAAGFHAEVEAAMAAGMQITGN
jgi:hypothetical protein